MGEKRKEEKSSLEKKKKKKSENKSNAIYSLQTIFDTLINKYPNDIQQFKLLLEQLDNGYFIDISNLEDQTIKYLLNDLFDNHFYLNFNLTTSEYFKNQNLEISFLSIYQEYLTNPKNFLERDYSSLLQNLQKLENKEKKKEKKKKRDKKDKKDKKKDKKKEKKEKKNKREDNEDNSENKTLLEMHLEKKRNDKDEIERKELEKKGYLMFNHDKDIQNPMTAVDKNRLLNVVEKASQFKSKFNQPTRQDKFM